MNLVFFANPSSLAPYLGVVMDSKKPQRKPRAGKTALSIQDCCLTKAERRRMADVIRQKADMLNRKPKP